MLDAGIEVDERPIQIQARLLEPPPVEFGGNRRPVRVVPDYARTMQLDVMCAL